MSVHTRGELIDKYSSRLTRWIGTPASIVLHSVLFAGIFLLEVFGVDLDEILLILTTAVSLEAIYLAIFIQMTVNKSVASLTEVEADIEEISDEVKDLGEDVDEISEDIDKIQEKEVEEEQEEADTRMTLEKIETGLQKLLAEIDTFKHKVSK